jgi:hypothetical protein
LLLALIAGATAGGASASDTVYCVGTTGGDCTTPSPDTFDGAMTQAVDGNTIRVGPGLFTSSVPNDRAVTLTGAGSQGAAAGGTTITTGNLGPSVKVLELGAGATVSHLAVLVPVGGDADIGMDLAGVAASDVSVTSPRASNNTRASASPAAAGSRGSSSFRTNRSKGVRGSSSLDLGP